MQLTAILLSIIALVLFYFAIRFVMVWHCAHRDMLAAPMLREGIGHIGISVVVEYPTTTAPLLAILEEEYPRCEAIIVTDLQQPSSPFIPLVQQFRLVKVNHSGMQNVCTLYRSRHRAFRRVVIVDLPLAYRQYAAERGREIATYDTILYLQGESVIARSAITYCANVVALHSSATDLVMESIIGAPSRLERGYVADMEDKVTIVADRPLAWNKESSWPLMVALLAPILIVLAAHFTGENLFSTLAIIVVLTLFTLLFLSSRLIVEKSLLVTLNTILRNFYRYLVWKVKNFDYLYGVRMWKRSAIKLPLPRKSFAIRERNNRKQL